MKRKYLMLVSIIIIIISAFYLPKKFAELTAIRYMEILTIYDDASFKEVKNKIYDISSDYVKDTLFYNDYYPLPVKMQDSYVINSVSSEFIGFNSYIVYIDFTVNENMRLTSAFEVEDGIVQDNYRVSK